MQQVIGLAATFNRDLPEAAQAAYLAGMSDVPRERFHSAIVEALRTCRFMPSVAELREFSGVEIPALARASIAFDALGRAVGWPGSYRSVVFDDPILNATIQSLGGWVTVCESAGKDWESFVRKRFIDAYTANLGAKRGTMHHQIGIAEQQNGGKGFDVEPPIAIGCKLPRLPGISYERPKPMAELIHEAAKTIGVER